MLRVLVVLSASETRSIHLDSSICQIYNVAGSDMYALGVGQLQ